MTARVPLLGRPSLSLALINMYSNHTLSAPGPVSVWGKSGGCEHSLHACADCIVGLKGGLLEAASLKNSSKFWGVASSHGCLSGEIFNAISR